MQRCVYFDNNATTPLELSVKEAIIKSLENDWGNPSSASIFGKNASKIILEARVNIANMISAPHQDIIFTSGGTESNNMVIQSVVRWAKSRGLDKPHIILSNVEHVATLMPLKQMAQDALIDFSEVPVDSNGLLHEKNVMEHIRPNTCLITIMMANNETGVIFPIKELAGLMHEHNIARKIFGLSHIWFHTDAAQAIGKIEVNVEELKVDYLTIVGHKFYGPRIGALYCRNPGVTPLHSVVLGGGQEKGYRAGTENTPMIVGLGAAAQLVIQNLEDFSNNMLRMRQYLEFMLLTKFGNHKVVINCLGSPRLPNTVNVSFANTKSSGEEILSSCTRLIASTTAACHSQEKLSSVLLKSGVPENLARTAIRLSLGRYTTMEDVDIVIQDLYDSYHRTLK
uniref:Selenocysteine lyase n=4 Tax=Clastoptera arizonana TaxID=38151 RepID=A0A1B6D9W7_9HEMI